MANEVNITSAWKVRRHLVQGMGGQTGCFSLPAHLLCTAAAIQLASGCQVPLRTTVTLRESGRMARAFSGAFQDFEF